MNENALKYLLNKQKSKGKEIEYSEIQIAEYLIPKNSQLTVIQKQKMFGVKSEGYKFMKTFLANS